VALQPKGDCLPVMWDPNAWVLECSEHCHHDVTVQ